jgi:hypothetical protein
MTIGLDVQREPKAGFTNTKSLMFPLVPAQVYLAPSSLHVDLQRLLKL